jgi:hypothetical protein
MYPDLTIPLSRPYTARGGAPVIAAVDTRLFTARYVGVCMSCSWCHDWCCRHGVDVDGAAAECIMERAGDIERFIGHPASDWFGEVVEDADLPGGTTRRTRLVDGRCVFLNPAGRGCQLHAFALAEGLDYHLLKPMISTLFPVTFCEGVLTIADELESGELVCADRGPTAYEAARGELAYYFGEELTTELDRLHRAAPASR